MLLWSVHVGHRCSGQAQCEAVRDQVQVQVHDLVKSCVCVAVSDASALSGSRSGPQCLSSRTHIAGSVIVVVVSDSGRLQRLYLVCNGSIVCVMSVTSVTPSRGQPGAWSLASICRTRPSSSESWCA